MKFKLFLLCASILFSFTATMAVNAVLIVKKVDNSKKETQTLAVKKAEKSLPNKIKASRFFNNLKNALDDSELILLALFLAPLAVWLKDGKSTSTMFWLTLIFFLLGVGVYWGLFFGVFWFIAFLLAVSHILDIF